MIIYKKVEQIIACFFFREKINIISRGRSQLCKFHQLKRKIENHSIPPSFNGDRIITYSNKRINWD